jgi:hypothetical protein
MAAAPDPSPKASPSPSAPIVPWLALSSGHQYAEAPETPPKPPLAVPPNTPRCAPDQIEGAAFMGGAGMGHADLLLYLRNRSSAPCSLEGFTDLTVLDAAEHVLAQAAGASGRDTWVPGGPVVKILIPPGTGPLPATGGTAELGVLGYARMHFEWYDCKRPQASTLVVSLPDEGGRVRVPFAFTGNYSPACDSPVYANSAHLNRGSLSPAGVDWAVQRSYLDVAINVSAPTTVRRGSSLEYTVTITNHAEQEYRLSPCPDYVESVGAKELVAEYQLNCAPAGTIAPRGSVTFVMRIDIPVTMTTGTKQITWALHDGRIKQQVASGTVQIV